ncbi:MAG: DUF58 domain-containing protein [Polyangiaceae bacterium]
MNLYPTRETFFVALSGAALVALGAAARVPALVAFGGAMVLAIAFGRAFARVSVARLRAAGFEMVWGRTTRVERLARGETFVLPVELRNRGTDDVRGVTLRPLASSMLDVTLVPDAIDLPPGARMRVDMTVTASRVGRWGVHGLALEVRARTPGGDALYEAPLLFANPFGVEVIPKVLEGFLRSAKGGRSRHGAELGRPSNARGEGDEFRELREHAPGDPFKRIAWKASARRGQLLVRELERDERDVVWLVLDNSVELSAGTLGRAPIDRALDEVATIAARHLARGDRVGLVVAAGRPRSYVVPGTGNEHVAKIASALASATNHVDADRCELDEHELAQRVAEHARPLDANGLADVRRGDLDALAIRASQLRKRAPFAPRSPQAASPREQVFRHYLAAFGIEVPPRVDGERARAEVTLSELVDRAAREKPRPSVVHFFGPAPSGDTPLSRSVERLRAKRIVVRWTLPSFEESVGGPWPSPAGSVPEAVEDAVRVRSRAAHARSERTVKRLGAKIVATVRG